MPRIPVKPKTASRAVNVEYGYHVTNIEKLRKFEQSGEISAPVFLWKNVKDAVKMRRTHNRRTIILKAPIPAENMPDPGHPKTAVLCQRAIPFDALEEVTG